MASLAGGFLPVAAQPYGIANPDARTLGMGGIETVTSADAYAVFNNPAAGLFGRQKAQVATSFFTLSDKTTYSAAGYYKFNMQHLLAGGWRTFGFDERLKDKSVSLAYAYRLNDIVALGLTADYARFVRERSGNAFSAGITAQAVVPFERGENYAALRLDDEACNGRVLDEMFRENPSIAGAVTFNSTCYILAGYLAARRRDGVRLVGYDVIRRNGEMLSAGVVTALVAQRPEAQGYRAVMALCEWLVEGRAPSKVNNMPIDILLKENIPYYKNNII